MNRPFSAMLVLGTEAGCGKTVVLTGIAATLQQEGLACRATKPIQIGTKENCQGELAFIRSITQSPLNSPVQHIAEPGQLSLLGWHEAMRSCQNMSVNTFVELPASCASPITRLEDGLWKDTADFARQLGWPCLLVAKHDANFLEKLVLNSGYLTSRRLSIIGMVSVETTPNAASFTSPDLEMSLQERTGVPYLGCLPFSPSIDVQNVNQGNLIKTTSCALDLLPIIRALNLCIPV